MEAAECVIPRVAHPAQWAVDECSAELPVLPRRNACVIGRKGFAIKHGWQRRMRDDGRCDAEPFLQPAKGGLQRGAEFICTRILLNARLFPSKTAILVR